LRTYRKLIAGILQAYCCKLTASLLLADGRLLAGFFVDLLQAYGMLIASPFSLSAGSWQAYGRLTVVLLQTYCRLVAGLLQAYCKLSLSAV
jgi:hypothetical protein